MNAAAISMVSKPNCQSLARHSLACGIERQASHLAAMPSGHCLPPARRLGRSGPPTNDVERDLGLAVDRRVAVNRLTRRLRFPALDPAWIESKPRSTDLSALLGVSERGKCLL